MNEDVITDLKQFISATVSQQTSELHDKFNGLDGRFNSLEEKFDRLDTRFNSLEKKVDKIDQKVDDLSLFVTDALDTNNEIIDKQLKNHERRITRIEHKIA